MAELFIKDIVHYTNKIRISNSSGLFAAIPVMVDEEQIVVEGDMKPIGAGHIVSLECDIKVAQLVRPFTVSAEVISQETMLDNNRRLVLRLHEYDRVIWGDYLKALGQEQARIEKIFRKFKGSDE